MPTFIRNFTCSIGEVLANNRDYWGWTPLEVCPDETPPPTVEEAFIEEVPEGDDTQWELIIARIPGEVEQAFANLPINGGTVSFDEELMGFGYINQHTNVYADVESQTFAETLLGIEVEIRAIPLEYRFDYGDGTVATTSDPGGPTAQNGSAETPLDVETPTSHIYQETGTYPVDVTTTFIGEYRLPDGGWTPISGSTTIPASPGEADIWRLSHKHVSSECRDTHHWGCSGPVELEPGDTPPKIFADQYDPNGRYIGTSP